MATAARMARVSDEPQIAGKGACGGCGKEVFNMAFCGACFAKLPARLKNILWGPNARPEYARAVEEAKTVLKILRDKPLSIAD